MRWVGWAGLMVCLLLSAAVLGQTTTENEDEDDADQAHVESEDEEAQPPGAKEFNLNLVDDTTDPNADIFVPTKEWQTIKKDQPVPKGLHYRLNLQTGLREAKLLDDTPEQAPTSSRKDLLPTGQDGSEVPISTKDSRLLRMKKAMEDAMGELDEKKKEGKVKYWKKNGKQGMMKLKDMTFSRDELKDALKKFKLRDDDVQDENLVKNKYRSMKEIKADFEALNMKMTMDTELLRDLLKRYQDELLTEQGRVEVLTELEYYLHQIDNAVNFADMGGLDLIIKDLNNTSDKVRTEAAFVLGSASQSNPKVQVKVLELGAPLKLIRMLSTDASESVQTRALYALSCSMRQFPFAQKNFVENGGVHILTSALTQVASPKLRLKAMTLALDLLQERKQAELHTRIADTTEFARLQQYKNIPLQEALLEQGWCSLVPGLLEDTDHDTLEKVLTAMHLLGASCRKDFSRSARRLAALQAQYRTLAQEELQEDGEEGYFTTIYELVSNVMEILRPTDKQPPPKQEL